MTTAAERTIAVAGGVQLYVDTTDPNNPRIMARIDGVASDFARSLLDKDSDFTIKLADTTGVTGKNLAIKGSDTDGAHIGGQVRIQSGRGFDSNGIVFSEGEGNADYVQAFWEGGASPQVTIFGNGGGTPILKFQQGDGVINGLNYLDSTTTYMFGRVNNGTVVYRLGTAGMRIGDSGVPVECLEVVRNTSLEGSFRLKSLPVTDKSGGGNIGTAAATVDIYSSFDVNQTTAAQTLVLPTPTTATSGRLAYVSNVGSVTFTMLGATVAIGGTLQAKWTGAAWSKVS